eukprot:m.17426 g.17426  ORF g.17426 m.17426 type:complete len:61 (-) comp11228_c0_seq2:22-204(-)
MSGFCKGARSYIPYYTALSINVGTSNVFHLHLGAPVRSNNQRRADSVKNHCFGALHELQQ